MKLPLKTKIAFWWWKKFRFKEPANKIQRLSEESESLNSLLFILPQDRVYLSIALHFLKILMAKGSFESVKRIIGFENYKDDFNTELKKKIKELESKRAEYRSSLEFYRKR